ncbi:DUF378 domain-containing protein [Clostridium algidicarnis]|uniref:DUF378 domain-containing protein n=2 Tax=Clostridium algidicarnis TaxID=37659 RepID=A0A2S6FXU9_9CLOT|nr:DUF378 domain-containing protein [Clostridium algidicarnis]MBB6630174.1 DUF378 domain-containing protein [Clostridium algidicarnis]MBB6697518.1 DUF378 domain-containing protein [Clostridium algidicarnis]MBU3193005.1 DUF378 domain-containing protein [Clostridium algidicarnis]MBU3203393.1 DUF378 domain-containing protein [Clostridium algidicarnis]MBU3206284.1 DUF378 domain-containing protein [Clostridium algidicarnis]
MYKLNIFDKISFILVIIGSINMGLIGVTNTNIFYLLFSSFDFIERLLYIIIGISGLNLLVFIFRTRLISFKEK